LLVMDSRSSSLKTMGWKVSFIGNMIFFCTYHHSRSSSVEPYCLLTINLTVSLIVC
jgi:hypothetical protein